MDMMKETKYFMESDGEGNRWAARACLNHDETMSVVAEVHGTSRTQVIRELKKKLKEPV